MERSASEDRFVAHPTSRGKPLAGSAAVLVVALLMLPWAREPLPGNDALVSSLIVLLLAATTLSAVLLVGRFIADGQRQRLIAGATFAATSAVLMIFGAAFPGVLTRGTFIGSGQTGSVWLAALYHLVLAGGLALSGAVLAGGVIPLAQRTRVWRTTVAAAILLSWAVSAMVIAFESVLPTSIMGNSYLDYARGLGLLVAVVLFGFMVASWRATGPLQQHISPMVTAVFADWLLYAYAGERYTLGWYVGRVVLLAVVLSLLVSLLAETTKAFGIVARQATTMRDAALTDPLTGLPNRRGVLDTLEGFPAGVPFRTLAVIDIDDFKAINDRNGHDAGDAALEAVAGRMRAALRGDDILARWGGDELLLLSCIGQQEAPGMLERLRHLVADNPIRIDNGPIGLTVSIGATPMAPFTDFDHAFTSADRGLFAAKKAGRNRVVFADDGCVASPPGYGPSMDGEKTDPQGSQPAQTDAQPPGDSQVTNPNKEIGDGAEVADDTPK